VSQVSGQQVAPSEIEDTLLAEPHHLIDDATVVGVSGGRTSDERVPRAWVVLSDAGKQRGAAETIKVLDAYIQQTLSKYKHLRGGIEVVSQLPKSPTGKVSKYISPAGRNHAERLVRAGPASRTCRSVRGTE
jgi:acyl-coenzyme A synthetase/AMP-(fatty) acid ligase